MSLSIRHSPVRQQHCTCSRQHFPLHNSSSSTSNRNCRASSAAAYTPLDSTLEYRTFKPPLIDISNILAGQAATPQQTAAVRQECTATGFLAIEGHGMHEQQLRQLFAAAGCFFDLPLDTKTQLVVENMQRGRGYEISPEHKEYMQNYQQQQQHCCEPSAAAGILSERFCCGPPLTEVDLQDPYYASEQGQVFFTPDQWPSELVPELQPAMQGCYAQSEAIAAAVLSLFATALGMKQDFFADKICRHHSNLQVANYPSQLVTPGPNNLRKKAHADSGTLTILASQDYLPGSSWQAGDGGLQLLSPQGHWLEVEVPPGALLLNLGNLMTRWTNGLWKSTLHRVTNPLQIKAHNSRRLSMAFFQKPNYDAVIEVLPSCYANQYSHPDATGELPMSLQLPDAPLFPPAVVGDLTRQGVLHKLKHLPPEQASRKYHELLAATWSTGS